MFNSELFKAIAPEAYGLFEDLKKAKEQLVILEDENRGLNQENQAVWERLHRTMNSHAVICRGVRAAMGLRNWPRMPGMFNRAVGRLLKKYIDDLKLENEYAKRSDIY